LPGTLMNTRTWQGGGFFAAAFALALGGAGRAMAGGPPNNYLQTNLVSDLPGVAAVTDPSLVNPWGLVASATSPWWVSDNGSGLSTLYTGAGSKLGLTVTIQPVPGGTVPADPTGIVFNGGTGFGGKRFSFDTEDGSIAGWSGGNTAGLEVNQYPGSVFKGLALGSTGGNTYLYATDFRQGTVDVFNSSFGAATLTGSFTDPTLPSGYAPFDIANINGDLYVTYALQDAAKHDDVAGPGNGFVDIFSTDGSFIKRLVSNGWLDSPWGLALAPSDFGAFSGDLLVGDFGNGTINAFNPWTGTYEGTLDDRHGNPVDIQGLWGLEFGNGASAGAADTLYFTAGIAGDGQVEDHGLFGSLTAVPDHASTAALLAAGLLAVAFAGRRRFAYVTAA
jgi:uncharacterized protein (TIGR03118 family)